MQELKKKALGLNSSLQSKSKGNTESDNTKPKISYAQILQQKKAQSQTFSYSQIKQKIQQQQQQQQTSQQQPQQQLQKQSAQQTNQKDERSQTQLAQQILQIKQEQQQLKQQQKQQKDQKQQYQKQIEIIKQQQDADQKKQQLLLQTLNLPPQLKSNLPPDLNRLKQILIKKKKREEKIQQLIKEGYTPLPKSASQQDEDKEHNIDKQVKDLNMNEMGELRDSEGNIVKVQGNKKTTKINKQLEQKEKILKIKKLIQGQPRSNLVFDSNIIMTSNKKREKRKNHALHFIEPGSIQKYTEMRQQMLENQSASAIQSDQSNSTSKIVEEKNSGTPTNAPNPELQLKDPQQQLQSQSQSLEKKLENQQSQNIMNEGNIPTGIKRLSIKVKFHDPIPNIEWWDQCYFNIDRKYYLYSEKSEAGNEAKNQEDSQKQEDDLNILQKNIYELQKIVIGNNFYNQDKINNLIEHPLPFKQSSQQQQVNVVVPLYLTKDERKKIKRKKKLEKQKDAQDKIKLGLVKPPPPKVKLSNMMQVYAKEAVNDPSKVEQEVKRQIQERLQKHIEMNQKRKLTKEQKKEKLLRKLKKDSAIECRVAIFKIENLSDGGHRFKIDKNAQELQLHGICLISNREEGFYQSSITLVEGGPKAIKKFKKLMMKRIKWDQPTQIQLDPSDQIMETEEDRKNRLLDYQQRQQDLQNNKCILVWEGVIKDHNFNKWKIIDIKSEMEGKRALGERGVEYIWDMVQTYKEE